MARKKNEITLKEPVRIREKNLKDGNKSLYLNIYLNGNRKKEVNKVDKDFAKGFISFLKTCTFNNGKKTLSDTTQRIFVNRFGTIMENAIREGIVTVNPFRLLDKKEKPQKQNAEKEFLTIEELDRFLSVETATEPERIVQKAFGFASMTGLRLCDMRRLSWCHIKPMGDGLCVHIKQQKTKQWVTVPLNEKALSLLPPKPEVDDGKPIFKFFKKNDSVTMYVRRILHCPDLGWWFIQAVLH